MSIRLSSCALLVGAALVAGGCGSSGGGTDAASTTTGADTQTVASSGDPSSDKLAQVLARGTLILFTDPAYPPQSYAVKGAKRLTTTKCAANQLTGNQITGYDAETGKLVAKQLGIEPCFVTPSWTEVTGGTGETAGISPTGREPSRSTGWTSST